MTLEEIERMFQESTIDDPTPTEQEIDKWFGEWYNIGKEDVLLCL